MVFYFLVSLTIADLPRIYAEKVLKFVAAELETTRHVQFYLLWIELVLTEQGLGMPQISILLTLHKNIQRKYDDLSKMYEITLYLLL